MQEVLKMVKEFQDLFEKPMTHEMGEEPLNIRQLRAKLLFEESVEYAEASDVKLTWAKLCLNYLLFMGAEFKFEESNKTVGLIIQATDGNNVDLIEQADALGDIQVILSGSILTARLEPYIMEVIRVIHQNNMAKAHVSKDHCLETVFRKGMLDYKAEEREGKWFLYNKDGKLTKPWNHAKVKIGPFIPQP
jgi:predicted HAD superfamily Cof-like phosphohydrolase